MRGFCIQFITITPKFPLPSGAEMSIISAPVPGRNRTLSGFLVSLTEGVPFIMKLHHRMLRHFIAASVIVLTSSFLIFELVASDRAMSAYLRYIVQKADSSFLYDKYQNQITEITDSTAENLVLYAKFLDESTISEYTVEYYKQKEDESGYDLVTE